MAKEIERKFLVTNDTWQAEVVRSWRVRQGYLAATRAASVRVRIVDDERAMLTIKSGTASMIRDEFEYPVPVDDARRLLSMCEGWVIEKIRHELASDEKELVVDRFLGANSGLIIAEIELDDEDRTPSLPPWVGREVTEDPNYLNSHLASHPYQGWSAERRA